MDPLSNAIVIFFFSYLILCGLIGQAAASKGRSRTGFVLLSFFFSPILGAIIVMCIKREPKRQSNLEKIFLGSKTKKCPFCAEEIKREAIVCRYCRRDIPEHPVRPKSIEEKLREMHGAKIMPK